MITDLSPALLSRIEDAGLNASAPPQQRWLDGWLVRLSPGKAKRARCVNALALGRQSLAYKLAQCEQAYAEAGLPMIVRITPFTLPAELDAMLDRLGLGRIDDTRVMVLPELGALPDTAPTDGVALHPVSLEAFAQRVGALRQSPLAQRLAHGQRLLNAPVPFSAFEWRRDGELLACGQYAVEAGLVGLYDVYTEPAQRGQGHARQLCLQLLQHARARGARHGYLQVEGDNGAARSVYHRLGFIDGYAYHYRTHDPAAA